MRPLARLLGAALLLAPAGIPGFVGAARAANAAAGQQVFRSQCAICHSDKAGVNKIGPSLFGVVGRHTGSEPGYDYSVANKNANLVWTPAVLDAYIEHPQKVVPGTKMPYGGLPNATKRANLVAFLKTLKAPAAVADAGAPHQSGTGRVVGQAGAPASSHG